MNKKLVRRKELEDKLIAPLIKVQDLKPSQQVPNTPRQEQIQPVMSHAERNERSHQEREKIARQRK